MSRTYVPSTTKKLYKCKGKEFTQVKDLADYLKVPMSKARRFIQLKKTYDNDVVSVIKVEQK